MSDSPDPNSNKVTLKKQIIELIGYQGHCFWELGDCKFFHSPVAGPVSAVEAGVTVWIPDLSGGFWLSQ